MVAAITVDLRFGDVVVFLTHLMPQDGLERAGKVLNVRDGRKNDTAAAEVLQLVEFQMIKAPQLSADGLHALQACSRNQRCAA